AICAAGGKKICDDQLPLCKLIQISGKSLLPRLDVSATIPPSPMRRTVGVRWQSQRTRSRLDELKRAVSSFRPCHPMCWIIALQLSIVNESLSTRVIALYRANSLLRQTHDANQRQMVRGSPNRFFMS